MPIESIIGTLIGVPIGLAVVYGGYRLVMGEWPWD